MGRRFGVVLATSVSLVVGVIAPTGAQQSQASPAPAAPKTAAFVSPSVLRAMQGAEKGAPATRVIVSFDTRGGRSSQSISDVSAARTSVLSAMPAGSYSLVSSFSRIPAVALAVNELSLDALRANPLVYAINEDSVVTTDMVEANALTGVGSVHTAGITGDGATVAIIDSGVDSAAGVVHPALADDLAGQHCFRTENDCINSVNSAKDQNGHGTHVAGIITGPNGVAPDARFYALKVFTTGTTSDTNILNALNYVIDLNTTSAGTVDLVNMSLGGDNYSDQTTCDANGAAYLAAFSTLNAQGVTVFVATGNDASITEVSSPGCLTGAVGVGSVGDAAVDNNFLACTDNALPDKVSCFSNATPVQGAGELVDMMAPGCSITSTGLDESTTFVECGTSMATPYSAGTAALLLEYLADHSLAMTPAQIEAHIEATGVQVADYRMAPGAPTFPRVSPPRMIGSLEIGAPGNFQITGSTTSTVSMSWSEVPSATEYHVYRSSAGGTPVLAGTVTPPDLAYVDSAAPCGSLTYFVRAFDGSIESLDSDTDSVTARSCPVAPTGLALSVVDADTHTLSWTDGNSDETANILQRSVNGGAFTDYQTLAPGTALQFTDDALACGLYRYRAIAETGADRSAASNEVQRAVCAPANDDFANAQVVPAGVPLTDTEPNASYASEEPLDPNYSCRFNGAGPGFQGVWYDITPATPTLATITTAATTVFPPSTGLPDTLLAVYTGTPGSLTQVACNDDISGVNFRSTLTVNLNAGTTYHVFVSQWVKLPAGTVGNLVTDFTWATGPDNDLVANARVVNADNYTSTVTSAQTATVSATDLPHSCSFDSGGTNIVPRVGSHTLWWTFTPTADGTVDLDTLSSSGSFTDTIMSVYTGTPGAFTVAACNDDATSASSLRSRILDLPVTAGTTYTIYVSRWSATAATTAGTAVLHSVFSVEPAVVINPETVDVTEGGATDAYTAVLATAPTADVTVSVTGDADCTAAPASLTFAPANWSVPQTVTVTAVDDLLAEGTHSCTITHAATSTDAAYNGLPVASVTGTVTDHVIPASVSISKAAVAPTSRPEPGGAFSHTLVIRNLSPVPATIMALTDEDTLSAGCRALISTSLAANDSAPGGADEATCTSTGTHTAAGSFTTTASVSVSNAFAQTDTKTASAAVTVTDVPLVDGDVTITGSADPASVPETGGNVAFTLVVTNNSQQPFTVDQLVGSGVTVSAIDAAAVGGCLSGVGTSVPAGGTFTCSFSQFVSGEADNGPTAHMVTVTVSDANGNRTTGAVTVHVNLTAVTAPTTPTVPPTTIATGRQIPATGGSIAGTLLLAASFLGVGAVLVRRRERRNAS